ncbi:P-loop NTPase fold protein [Nonomuraea sp. B19D2]|uniref:P-loop NTPase fold protein n=1 Tax=Nonomuraea sp. B19D2 TaxID=3159561 RepID=UPI0032D9F268
MSQRGIDLNVHHDRPISSRADDALGFTVYADTIAETIENPRTELPHVIAIHGAWGSGKSSLANLVAERLSGRESAAKRFGAQDSNIVCRFNARMHADAPHLGAALAAHIARTVNRRRALWRRFINPLPGSMLTPEERWRRAVIAILLLAMAAVALVAGDVIGPELRDVITPGKAKGGELPTEFALTPVALLGSTVLVGLVTRWLFTMAKAVGRFIDSPRSEAARGRMTDVHRQLGALIGQALRRDERLVIVVDDLERCAPARALEVCETTSTLLDHKGVVTILLADMNIIARAAGKQQAEAPGVALDGPGTLALGRAYLEKLIQDRFDLPPARPDAIAAIIADDPRPTRTPPPSGGWQRIVSGVRRHPVAFAIGFLALIVAVIVALAAPGWAEGATAPQGSDLAPGLRDFVASLVTVLIGVIGLKFLFGEQRSLAGFLGFLVLGVTVFALIKWGDVLLDLLGNAIRSDGVPLWLLPGTGVVALILVALRLGDVIVDLLRRSLALRSHLRLRQVLERAEAGSQDHVELEENALAAAEDLEQEIRRHLDRRVVDDAEFRRDSIGELGGYLPATPRAAKRFANRLRLLSLIARRRRFLDGPDRIEPRQLGKWALIQERWPPLAEILVADPGVIVHLERSREAGEIEQVLERLGLMNVTEPAGLLSSSVRLSPVLSRLVYLTEDGPERVRRNVPQVPEEIMPL